jgi:hypothetical protein
MLPTNQKGESMSVSCRKVLREVWVALVLMSMLSVWATSSGAVVNATKTKPTPAVVYKWILSHCGTIASSSVFHRYLGVSVSSLVENVYKECSLVRNNAAGSSNGISVVLFVSEPNANATTEKNSTFNFYYSAREKVVAGMATDTLVKVGGIGKGAFEFSTAQGEHEFSAWNDYVMIDVYNVPSTPMPFVDYVHLTRAIFDAVNAEANS